LTLKKIERFSKLSPSECGYAEAKMMIFRRLSKGMKQGSCRETLYVHFRGEKINPKMSASTFDEGALPIRMRAGIPVTHRGVSFRVLWQHRLNAVISNPLENERKTWYFHLCSVNHGRGTQRILKISGYYIYEFNRNRG
jgi:hypothetical protein